AMGLLVLVPLVAIWRNISALSMIFAELAAQRSRASPSVVENGCKVLAAAGLAYWLSLIVPTGSLSRLAWPVIIGGPAAVRTGFSRRIIYWHSEWQTTLRGVFLATDERAPASRSWLESSGDWNIHVQECVLPERAACSGRTLAELGIRARFGSS